MGYRPYIFKGFIDDGFDIQMDAFRNRMKKLKEKNMSSIPKTIKKRFYVGSLSVFQNGNNHLKTTLSEAVDEAKRKLEETDEEQFVVQIVRVVRREQKPIIVEKV